MTRDEVIAVVRRGMEDLERSLQTLERADGYALNEAAQVVVHAAFVISAATTLSRVLITMGRSAGGSFFAETVRSANAARQQRKGS
jgi:hypothetical protein